MLYTERMEILGKLFGSQARVKIMRLFLLNQTTGFESSEIAKRSRVTSGAVRSELATLLSAGFVKKKMMPKALHGKAKSKKVIGWFFNHDFIYRTYFQDLLIDGGFLRKEDLTDRFHSVGKIKLFVVSGIFLHEKETRVDILMVGDNLKRNLIEQVVRTLESEIGKELSYAVFDTQEFLYRISMYDKLVRDILDYPHERLIESREFSTLALKKG